MTLRYIPVYPKRARRGPRFVVSPDGHVEDGFVCEDAELGSWSQPTFGVGDGDRR